MSTKRKALQRNGCLNPAGEILRDEKFEKLAFFDSDDLVQVKYEMLRRVSTEKESVVAAVRDFGYSRPAYYRAKEQLEKEGLVGLVPRKRGPKGGHKLTAPVVEFLLAILESQPDLAARDLASCLQKEFNITVHPRSIERAFSRRKKNSD